MDRPAPAVGEGGDGGRDLLRRLRGGDRKALEELAVRYGSVLTRAAYVHLGDAHAAADAAQDALIAAWDGAGRTGDETPLRPWLFGILFNTCRRSLRSLSRRRRREEKAAGRRTEAVLPEPGRDLGPLRRALSDLNEGMRSVIVLRYEEGMSVAETAAALGIPEGTVKSRTRAAIDRLRRVMEEER